MDEKISVIPKPFTRHIEYVSMSVDNFRLNADSCTFTVYQYDENMKLITVDRIFIPPEIYRTWGSCDEEIINWVLQQLDFQRSA